MIRYLGTVYYDGGREEPFEGGIRAARAWESYARRHDLPLNPTDDNLERFPVASWRLAIAHASLGVEVGLDVWAESVLDVTLEATDVVPPTRQEVSSV